MLCLFYLFIDTIIIKKTKKDQKVDSQKKKMEGGGGIDFSFSKNFEKIKTFFRKIQSLDENICLDLDKILSSHTLYVRIRKKSIQFPGWWNTRKV